MQTTISSRHIALDPDLRDRAEQVLARLARQGRRTVEGVAVFDATGGRPQAELRVHCSGGVTLVARAAAPDFRSALDTAENRLKNQLARVTSRPRRRQPAG
jgi:ribosomal subunit interface protein